MDRTSPEMIREVERVLERKLSSLVNEEYAATGGIEAIVEMLNQADRGTEKSILESLEEDDPEALKAMLDPIPNEVMETTEISRDVNDPANDDRSVIEPVETDQTGLQDF
jgi:hypothetical protein